MDAAAQQWRGTQKYRRRRARPTRAACGLAESPTRCRTNSWLHRHSSVGRQLSLARGATDFINVVLTPRPTNVQVHLAPDDSASAARLAALKHRLPFEAIASSLYAETGVETVETPRASRAPL